MHTKEVPITDDLFGQISLGMEYAKQGKQYLNILFEQGALDKVYGSKPHKIAPDQTQEMNGFFDVMDKISPFRYGPTEVAFLNYTFRLMDTVFADEEKYDPATLWYVLGTDTHNGKPGIIRKLIPNICLKILDYQIDPSTLQFKTAFRTKWKIPDTNEVLASIHQGASVFEMLQKVLERRRQAIDTGSRRLSITFGLLISQAIELVEVLEGKRIEELELLYEKEIIYGNQEAARRLGTQIIEFLAIQPPEIPWPTITHRQKDAVLKSPDILVDPGEFGLEVDEVLTQFVREYVPNSFLDPKNKLKPSERTERHKRVVYVTPESIRNHPEGFYWYQRALVLAIAQKLDPGLLEKDRLVPIPDYINPHHKKIFRQQEAMLKQLLMPNGKESDWHYLLLNTGIQSLFIEMLPYCAVPPYVLTTESEAEIDAGTAYPAWFDAHLESDVVNQLPCFNHFKDSNQQLSVPARFVSAIQRAGGHTLVVSGLARAFFAGGTAWEKVNQEDYMIQPHNPEPAIDIDMQGYISPKLELAVIANDTVTKIRGRKGLFAALQYGIGMQDTRWTYFSQKQSDTNATRASRADSSMTFATCLYPWMGRAVNQQTDLLALGTLTSVKMRSFGLIPFVAKIGNTYAALAKPFDVYGGLIDYFPSMDSRRQLDLVSTDDALPFIKLDTDQHIYYPVAYWLAARIFSDAVWQEANIYIKLWNTILDTLSRSWDDTKTYFSLRPEQIKDLDLDAKKAISKALSTNIEASLELLDHAGFSNLFPAFEQLRADDSIWQRLVVTIRNNKQKDVSEKDRLIDAVIEVPAALRLFVRDQVKRGVSIPAEEQHLRYQIGQWLCQTIFS